MTRLRLRKNDPLRGLVLAIRGLPRPSRVDCGLVFPYRDFYHSILLDALFRRQDKFKGDFVFHYTSLDVFEKLIKPDGDLLMTRFDELNDDSEFEYGWQQIVQKMECNCGMQRRKVKLFVREKARMCAEGLQVPWIMSFSELPDSLSQWSMYTNRKSGGCSIAFDFREINYTVDVLRRDKRVEFDVWFLPCLYDWFEIERVWKVWCHEHNGALNAIMNLDYCDLKRRQADIFHPLIDDLFMLAAIIKHPGFSAEREWRLVVSPKKAANCNSHVKPITVGAKHRYGFNMCFAKNKPLYTMKWIRGVGLSPNPDKSRYDRFWKVFDDFCKAGRKQWETGVWLSEIPYNGK